MAREPGSLAISVELCPSVCERPPHVRRPSQTHLARQPEGRASFELDQPDWCAQPAKLIVLEELSTHTVFNVGDKPFYVIGRNEKADIVLDSLYVSRCVPRLCAVCCLLRVACVRACVRARGGCVAGASSE